MEGLDLFKNPTLTWFIIGLVFALLELVIPGLVIIFFGVGAWIVALCSLIFDLSLNAQILIFIVASVFSLVVLRKYLKNKFFGENRAASDALEEEFIGKTGIAETDMDENTEGKISFKGTLWNAETKHTIKKGDKVEIINKDSITLIVKPKKMEE